jgi:hypothetical protein
MGMHIPYASRSVMDCHYQGVDAPANVRHIPNGTSFMDRNSFGRTCQE